MPLNDRRRRQYQGEDYALASDIPEPTLPEDSRLYTDALSDWDEGISLMLSSDDATEDTFAWWFEATVIVRTNRTGITGTQEFFLPGYQVLVRVRRWTGSAWSSTILPSETSHTHSYNELEDLPEPTLPQDSRAETDPITDWPLGYSVMYSVLGTTWADTGQGGVVQTIRDDAWGDHQTFTYSVFSDTEDRPTTIKRFWIPWLEEWGPWTRGNDNPVLQEDTYAETDGIDVWPEGVSVMEASATANWNEEEVAGNVVTSRTSHGSWQMFSPVMSSGGDRTYRRNWLAANTWGSWYRYANSAHSHGNIVSLNEDTYAESDPITDWSDGVSVMGFSDTANWDGAGEFGRVQTNRTDDEGFQFMQYTGHYALRRYSGGWSAWEYIVTGANIVLVPLATDLLAESDPISAFTLGLQLLPVSAGANWGPNASEAGVVENLRFASGDGSQVFRALNGNTYRRTYTSGAWGSWTAYSMEGHTHSGYQATSEKGQNGGYASLDGSGDVPDAQIPAGIQRTSEKGQNSGYAALDSGGKVPDTQIPDGVARDAEVTSAISTHAGLTDPHTGYQLESEKGQNNGYAPLDSGGKLASSYLPSSVTGDVEYQGLWNATTNTPTLGNSGAGGVKGDLRKVSVAGTTSVDGVAEWAVGDWIIHNGTTWDKIDSTDQVSSVDGRTGVVTLSDLYAATGDTRIPSQGENDALQGTSGTPSNTNRFVTDGDSRNANARTPTAHASTHTNGTDDIQSASASQKGLMTTAYAGKVDGIEANATQDQTAAEIRTLLAGGGISPGWVDLAEQASPASPAADTGRLYGLDVGGKSELEYRDSAGVVGRPFRDSWFVVQNTTGSTIGKGSAVRVSGQSATGVPLIALADADASSTMPAAGLTMESIANNAYGRVMVQGILTGLNTSGLSAGTPVYVSGTAGGFTGTAPVYPAFRQVLGSVMSVNASTGELFVNVAHFFRQVGSPVPVVFFTGSTLTVVNGVGQWVATTNMTGTLTEVRARIATAPTGAAVNLRVNKNGSSATTFSVAASANSGSSTGLTIAIAAGDYITVDITQVGSTVAGSDLVVVGEIMTAA